MLGVYALVLRFQKFVQLLYELVESLGVFLHGDATAKVFHPFAFFRSHVGFSGNVIGDNRRNESITGRVAPWHTFWEKACCPSRD